jgi:hypothetical protein
LIRRDRKKDQQRRHEDEGEISRRRMRFAGAPTSL